MQLYRNYSFPKRPDVPAAGNQTVIQFDLDHINPHHRIFIFQLLWCHHTLYPWQPEGSPFVDLKLHLWLEKIRTHQFRKIYKYGCYGNLFKQFGCSVFCSIDVQDEWAEARKVHRDDMSRESVPRRLKGIWDLFTEMRNCLVDTIIGRLNRKSREFQPDLRNAPKLWGLSVRQRLTWFWTGSGCNPGPDAPAAGTDLLNGEERLPENCVNHSGANGASRSLHQQNTAAGRTTSCNH